MSNIEYSEQELQRRESLSKLRELGIELYQINTTAKEILEQ